MQEEVRKKSGLKFLTKGLLPAKGNRKGSFSRGGDPQVPYVISLSGFYTGLKSPRKEIVQEKTKPRPHRGR